jgi:hypothetical protein
MSWENCMAIQSRETLQVWDLHSNGLQDRSIIPIAIDGWNVPLLGMYVWKMKECGHRIGLNASDEHRRQTQTTVVFQFEFERVKECWWGLMHGRSRLYRRISSITEQHHLMPTIYFKEFYDTLLEVGNVPPAAGSKVKNLGLYSSLYTTESHHLVIIGGCTCLWYSVLSHAHTFRELGKGNLSSSRDL